MDNQFLLLKDRRFLPMFITQFLGAYNDNLYKTSLSVLVAYGLWEIGSLRPELIVSLAAALFILPFILFAPLAGQIADKFEKQRVMQIIKIVEILIVMAAGLGIWLQSIPLLLVVLFAFGTHSAFFSPCKFAILPQHLAGDELIGGNALVNTGTYIAILLGNIMGGLLALFDFGMVVVTIILLFFALCGFVASCYIPRAVPPAPGLRLNWNSIREAKNTFHFARSQPHGIFTAMIGCSWFFFVGAMILSQLPNYTKQVLGVDNVVLAFFMTVFSVGIGAGGLVNNRLLKSQVAATYVPFAACVIAFFAADLYFASRFYHTGASLLGDYLLSLPTFLSATAGWRIVIDLLMIALAGGLYVVPLKTIIQHRAPPESTARIVAAGSLLDASFILGSSIVAIFMLGTGFAIEDLFLMLALGNLGMAYYLRRLAPSRLLRKIFRGQYE